MLISQLVPTYQPNNEPRTDRAYDVVTGKYRWGTRPDDGIDSPYYDETARRMLYGMRNSMIAVADMLYHEGINLKDEGHDAKANDKFVKAKKVIELLETNLPESLAHIDFSQSNKLAQLYYHIGEETGSKQMKDKAMQMLKTSLEENTKPMRYLYEVTTPGTRYYKRDAVLSFEMSSLHYYYAQAMVLYEQFGGNKGDIRTLLDEAHWDYDELRNYYLAMESYYEEGDSYGLQDMAIDILELCDAVTVLQAMDPEEYAQQSEDILLVDSILEGFIEEYIAAGGTEETLKAYPAYRDLDRERSKRIYKAYMEKGLDQPTATDNQGE